MDAPIYCSDACSDKDEKSDGRYSLPW